MDVYLIRHTSIKIEPGICYGQSDIDVSDSFPEDAELVRSKLDQWTDGEAVFYSSPLKRCRKLAEALISPDKINFDPRLQELNFGDWELKRWEEIPDRLLKKWSSDMRVPCPGGESHLELVRRVIEWWQELKESAPPIAVVITHAGVIQSIMSHVLETSFANSTRLAIDWGHMSAITVDHDSYLVRFVNR